MRGPHHEDRTTVAALHAELSPGSHCQHDRQGSLDFLGFVEERILVPWRHTG